MTNLSVVILSKNKTNLEACVKAVRAAGETCRIIVVDDFPQGAARVTHPMNVNGYLTTWEAMPLHWVLGATPFVFARNANIGIRAAERGDPILDIAGQSDVILLNDDALLQTTGGFTLLQKAAEEHPEFGIIASTTNCVGNTNQYPKGIGLREDPRQVCFVCVLIPRRTIDVVGLLDERFIHYGMDDDDYSLRVRNAGLKLGIHDGCFVDHASLTSSYRGPAGAGGNYFPNLEIFKQKWGVDNFGKPA